MKTIQFEGQAYHFPDDFTDDEISQSLDSVKPVGALEDVAKTIPSAAVRSIANVAGSGGAIRELTAKSIAGLSNLLPEGYQVGADTASKILRHAPFLGGATPEQLQGAVEKATGPLYESQTLPGRLVGTGIEQIPNLVGGKGAGSLATRLLTNVAAPTAAIEATRGTGAEPAAALAATFLANKAAAPKAVGTAVRAADLEKATNDAYTAAHSTGVELSRYEFNRGALDKIRKDLLAEGKTERNAKPIFDALEHYENKLPWQPVTTHEFDQLRQEFGAATQSSEGNLRRAGGIAKEGLDRYLSSVPKSAVVNGDIGAFRKLIGDARENYKGAIRMNIAEGKQELGDLNAATAAAGQNKDNAMRQAFKQLIRPGPKGMSQAEKQGFNQPEIEAIGNLAKGGLVNNTLRGIGKLAPTDIIKMAIHGELAAKTGGMALPLTALSYAAKKIADRTTLRRTEKLLDLIGSRTPEGMARLALNARLNPLRIPFAATQRGLLSGALAVPGTGILGQ